VQDDIPFAQGSRPLSALELILHPHLPGSLRDPTGLALHFRAIVESSDDAIISKTIDGIVTSWNRGAENLFGYSAEEMVGRPLLLLFPGDRLTEEDLILERLREGERVDHFETVRVRKDGTTIHVSVTISPIHDAQGRIIGASKIARDITERKRAEGQLQLSSSVFTHTGEAVVITDKWGRILEVNQAFTTITGYTHSEVAGKDHRFFHSHRQPPHALEALLSQLRADGHCQGEVWSVRKEGSDFAGLLTVSAVKSADGAIQNYVVLFADITALRVQQERLEHVANFDALTDLPNRLLLSDRLRQAMAQAQRQRQTLAVLYLDLDGFKQINDRHGHSVGDELLVQLSRRMKAALREVDTLARFGGDEFVAVLIDVQGPLECRPLVERVLHACSEPVLLQGVSAAVSASIGVTFYPQDDSDADQLIRHADRAMYEAKQSGKNRFYVFDSAKDAEFRSQGEQILRMRLAIANGELELYYQPKVNLKTAEVVGLEALIRWQHPELGLLSPAAFLPHIERDAVIEEVGSWVLREAMEQMTIWLQAGVRMAVSINVAARQILHPDFSREIAGLLAAFPAIAASDLELEILETSALEDISAVSAMMQACHQLGVRFAVDDFGTGYSSLTYLKKLPAETLKIDQSFVRDMLVDHEDLAIVKGVIGLCEAFHRTAVAEGVESLAHGERLLELGCECAQGYGIARPMPAQQVLAWISTWNQRAPGPVGGWSV
jgi:diguanylate cyclase (GGDEF)-like protein/PAS domain S-box-containing protein